jgi:hypothetical protein
MKLHPIANWQNGGAVAASSLLTSLAAYYKLGEASGTRADSTLRGNDLAPQHAPGNATGIVDNALACTEGSKQWCSIADNADLSMGDIDFSISCWAYRTTSGGVDYPTILGKWLGSSKEYILGYDESQSKFFFQVSGDGTRRQHELLSSVASPTSATWYHIIVWHDATANTINMSVNNAAATSAAHSAGVFNGTSAFGIGNSYGDESYSLGFWVGRIDEVGVWKRLLTTDERTALYNGGSGSTHPFDGAHIPFQTLTFSDTFAGTSIDTAKWNTVSPFTSANGWTTSNGAGGPNSDELEAVISSGVHGQR